MLAYQKLVGGHKMVFGGHIRAVSGYQRVTGVHTRVVSCLKST